MRMIEDRFAAMVGPRYAGCRLKNYRVAVQPPTIAARQRAALDAVTEIAHNIREVVAAGTNLLIVGTMGTGKDHLISALIRAAMFSGMSVRRTDGVSLAGHCRDGIDERRREVDQLAAWVSPDLLVISDPDGERESKFYLDWLFRIVDGRYRAAKPTWVTCNAKAANGDVDSIDLSPLIGARTWDRLRHGATMVYCEWPSYRRPTAKQKTAEKN